MTEKITTINGNKQPVTRDLPKLVILTKEINDVALAHIFENTGLNFQMTGAGTGYEAQPETSDQIVRLLLTYNFKTNYYDNWQAKNTLYLKFDHHVGFQVDSICFDCVQHNHIQTNGLSPDSRLAC